MRVNQQSGVTLIELVVAIVIIGVALAGIVLAFNTTVTASADPVVEQQAISIAQAYIEEVSSKAYADPDGTNAGETRATFDDIDDYKGLHDAGARDQTGATIPGLGDYDVRVFVDEGAMLNGAGAKRITVTVSHAGITAIKLSTYRLENG